MPKESDLYRPVFSSDEGALCPTCGRGKASCRCAESAASQLLGDGKVRVRRETKGRGGKTVTTVSGLPLNAADLDTLGKELRRSCGSGGAVKNGQVEIQGDHVERILAELIKRGFSPKRAGG